MLIDEIQFEEISRAVRFLPCGQAPGIDGFSAEILSRPLDFSWPGCLCRNFLFLRYSRSKKAFTGAAY